MVLSVVLLIVELVIKAEKKQILTWVSVIGYTLAVGACFVFSAAPTLPESAFSGMVVMDRLGLCFSILSLTTALVGVCCRQLYRRAQDAARRLLLGAGPGNPRHDGHFGGARPDADLRRHRTTSISAYIMTGFARRQCCRTRPR